ncbi:sensor histidine kinase [Aliiglaciecola sp. M165]|uniref:sensor histidine kinase n=1 Tax=Aliiglaciecola sp. M165 TaxID=2593649 RepID=UPI00117CFA70|nr:ATP-binding protein [Aliiglaciecola sp. M165]TRY29860.1 GHKL domain-containing protein [Aliiglaciecola sp. M165]
MQTKINMIAFVCSAVGLIPLLWMLPWGIFDKVLLAIGVSSLSILLAHHLFRDTHEGLSALEMGLLNLKDGEYSTTLSEQNEDELDHLCHLYNHTVQQLRDEKHWLFQRELLLDKVTQSSPEALFLVNDQQQIVFSNIAARQFFNAKQGLEGRLLTDLLASAPKGVSEAVLSAKQGLFGVVRDDSETQTWHISTGNFVLNNQVHTLYILKQMTRELSRQEVAVWKKVIRIISHELNNSLGPISSMLHSGKIISSQFNEERLARVFSTIDERIKHLSDFVHGYGKFAKLPEPKLTSIDWQDLLNQLSQQWTFAYDKTQYATLVADPIQLEQLLINLIKNAHESGSEAKHIKVEFQQTPQQSIICVMDKGKGIAETVMNNVLVPFYSTKASGSGLGLALCREITDAHHGHISLSNRKEGGLEVRVTLPN